MFVCDGCGKERAGQPYHKTTVRLSDGTIDDEINICFPCGKTAEREEKELLHDGV